jgi:hypothetical protein
VHAHGLPRINAEETFDIAPQALLANAVSIRFQMSGYLSLGRCSALRQTGAAMALPHTAKSTSPSCKSAALKLQHFKGPSILSAN